jgi:hypothetical protein
MADEDSKTTNPEAEENRTPAAEPEDSSYDDPSLSGDTGGGSMPWGDKPGG